MREKDRWKDRKREGEGEREMEREREERGSPAGRGSENWRSRMSSRKGSGTAWKPLGTTTAPSSTTSGCIPGKGRGGRGGRKTGDIKMGHAGNGEKGAGETPPGGGDQKITVFLSFFLFLSSPSPPPPLLLDCPCPRSSFSLFCVVLRAEGKKRNNLWHQSHEARLRATAGHHATDGHFALAKQTAVESHAGHR